MELNSKERIDASGFVRTYIPSATAMFKNLLLSIFRSSPRLGRGDRDGPALQAKKKKLEPQRPASMYLALGFADDSVPLLPSHPCDPPFWRSPALGGICAVQRGG